jgi:hypothetical protein
MLLERSYISQMRVSLSWMQRAVYSRFTRDVEARIVAWVQKHELLYIKTHELYCNRGKKHAAWANLLLN